MARYRLHSIQLHQPALQRRLSLLKMLIKYHCT
jgi:hypothetical protein